ncbi:MAG TPA: thiol oxidoreductase, partial [Cytophagales bacterium]|nr:thiol oxidoreductase [Cytophagales bacterium]
NDAPEEFRNIVLRPYTDMKMHTVTDAPYRTPALWGLGRNITLLQENGKQLLLMHDGRATTLDGAIQAHGGEASGSRAAYNAMSSSDKAALIAFLESL